MSSKFKSILVEIVCIELLDVVLDKLELLELPPLILCLLYKPVPGIPVFKYDQNTCTWGANYSAVEGIEEGESEYYNKIESALKQYTSTYALSNYTDKWFGDSTTGRYGYYDKKRFD